MDDASAYGTQDEQEANSGNGSPGNSTEGDGYPDAVLEDEAPENAVPERDELTDDPELEDRS